MFRILALCYPVDNKYKIIALHFLQKKRKKKKERLKERKRKRKNKDIHKDYI